MSVLSWIRLAILVNRLKFGAFGKYNRYRCWCLERKVQTTTDKLRLAREVLSGPGVSLAESQHNVEYIRKQSVAATKATRQPAENTLGANPSLHRT